LHTGHGGRIGGEVSDAEPRLLRPDFLALLCVQLATGFAFATFFLLPKFMVEELLASPTQVGLVSAGFGLSSLCAVPVVGRLLDRGHSKLAILLGSGLMACSAFGFVLVERTTLLPFLLRFAQGACIGMVVNGGSMLVSQLAPPARLAEAIGMFAAANLVMNAIAPVSAELIAQHYGYAPCFVMAGASALLALGLALRLRPAAFVAPEAEASLRDMLTRASYLRMVAILSLTGAGFGVVFTFVAPFALSLGLSQVRGFFVAFACSAVVMRVFVLRGLTRYGERAVARISLLFYGLSVLAVAYLGRSTLALLGAFLGLAHGVFMPVFTALMLREAPLHERGRMLSLFNASFGLGNAAVLGLGICVERFGYRPVYLVTGAFVCLAPLLFESMKPADTLAEPLPGLATTQHRLGAYPPGVER
jgi:MFS family permease